MEKVFNDFRDMSVWQKAFALLKDVYKIVIDELNALILKLDR